MARPSNRQIVAIADGINRGIERVMIRLTLEITSNLIEATPVDTGWAKANWVPSVAQPVTVTFGTKGAHGMAAAAQQQGMAEVAAYRLDQGRVFISNNVPYIPILNSGSSKQAPARFIEREIDRGIATVGSGRRTR